MSITVEELVPVCLKRLEIYKPYVNAWKKNRTITFFERYGGYYLWQEEEIEVKARLFEAKYDITIYAAIHDITNFGEMWSFLYVPNDLSDYNSTEQFMSDWFMLESDEQPNVVAAPSYVYNQTYPMLSEFGDIVVKYAVGGLCRIG